MALSLGVNTDLRSNVIRKFGRNYILNVQTRDGKTLTIKPPFTLEFDITRNTMTSANVASFRVYNLNANNRAQIRKNVNDFGDFRVVQLMAGYGNNLSLIFDGTITTAWSVREGTNFITQIESLDGGFAFVNAKSNVTIPAKTEQKTVVGTLMKDLVPYGVTPGAIGDFPGSLVRGNSYSGDTTSLLQDITGGKFFIDNAKAYALADNECVEGPVMIIDKNSGLLETPVREQTIIHFDMLLEAKLSMAQLVQLNSITADNGSNINGRWRVISLKHRGVISEAVCGSAITSVGLYQPLGSDTLVQVEAA